ncbi:unnamed protein product [Sphagnum compactum]
MISGFETPRVHLDIHWNTASFSDAEGRHRRHHQHVGPDRKTVSWMGGMKDSLESVLLSHALPNAHLDIHVTVLQSDGSVLAVAMNALSLALMDAGLPMCDILCACSIGLASLSGVDDESVNPLSTRTQNRAIRSQHQEYVPVVDISGMEEQHGVTPILTAAFLPRSNLVSFLHLEHKLPSSQVDRMIEMAKSAVQETRFAPAVPTTRNKTPAEISAVELSVNKGSKERQKPMRQTAAGLVSGPFSLGPGRDPSMRRSHRLVPVDSCAFSDRKETQQSEDVGFAVSEECYSLTELNGINLKREETHDFESVPNAPISSPGSLLFNFDPVFNTATLADKEKLFFIQLPSILPTVDPDYLLQRMSKMELENDAASEMTEKSKDAPFGGSCVDGKVGKLVVYRSGKVLLRIGDMDFVVHSGSECLFSESLVHINGAKNHLVHLGAVQNRLVVSPAIFRKDRCWMCSQDIESSHLVSKLKILDGSHVDTGNEKYGSVGFETCGSWPDQDRTGDSDA